MTQTKFLKRPQGVIAYDCAGTGKPLVVCIPGMGDLRAEYRFLIPVLVVAGYTVVTMDLRGHGESSTSFTDVSPAAIGSDIVALLAELGASGAAVIGTSMAAAATVWAAAEAPALIDRIVLVGPFVRDMPITAIQRLMLKAMMVRLWGPVTWGAYYKSLYPFTPPSDLSAYCALLKANLREPGRFEALQRMVFASKLPCEARIAQVKAQSLVIMGTKDPDFPNPAGEARAVAQRLAGEVLLVDGVGHYPHAENPDLVGRRIVEFLAHG